MDGFAGVKVKGASISSDFSDNPVTKMSYNLNTNISKTLVVVALFVTIILYTVYNQLQTAPLLPATCNSSTYACLSLAHGLSVAVKHYKKYSCWSKL